MPEGTQVTACYQIQYVQYDIGVVKICGCYYQYYSNRLKDNKKKLKRAFSDNLTLA